jgi:hypothetical protein
MPATRILHFSQRTKLKLNLLAALAASSFTAHSAASQKVASPPGTCSLGDALHVNNDVAAIQRQVVPGKGTRHFLASSHLFGEFCPARSDNAAIPAIAAQDNDSCNWITNNMASKLSHEERALVATTVDGSRIINKCPVSSMKWLLENFPAEKAGKTGNNGVCTTLLPEKPLVTTFNWKDEGFYGLILNPERMVPIIAGPVDLGSDCFYDEGKWEKAPASGQPPRWNNRQIVNVDASGKLCHDISVSMQGIASDIALDGGMHSYIEKGKVLELNEMVLVRNDRTDLPLCNGVFLDLTSNVLTRALQYRPLAWMIRALPSERWTQAIQAVNIQRLQDRQHEFLEAKRLCADLNLPFLVRSVNPDGQVEFTPIDLEGVESIDDLVAKCNVSTMKDPALEPVASTLSALLRQGDALKDSLVRHGLW